MGGAIHIAEMAHVIPHGVAGPRQTARPLSNFDADTFENLLLLCPTCHTKIDKHPRLYPRIKLLAWKENHFARLAIKLGIKAHDDRKQARAQIAPIFAENRAIWEKFAPVSGSEFQYDPESGDAALWDNRIISVVLPNHYCVLAIIEANLGLATENERRSFAEYQEHVRGLSERHVFGAAGSAIPFPRSIAGVFV